MIQKAEMGLNYEENYTPFPFCRFVQLKSNVCMPYIRQIQEFTYQTVSDVQTNRKE